MSKDNSVTNWDNIYSQGGWADIYNLPYQYSQYFPMFKKVVKLIKQNEIQNVLEVGCGNGAFADLLVRTCNVQYIGFDQSSIAIEKARSLLKKSDFFFAGDALDGRSYHRDYESIVCLEVLEHVVEDFRVIANWKKGALCICSVPNFDAQTHVRVFRNEDQIVNRYKYLLDVKRIVRVIKPIFPDLSTQGRLRYIYHQIKFPIRLFKRILFPDFNDGGWFVFVAQKR